MFGKVQEDSFQNIFDMSLEDNSLDSKSLGLGWGLGSSTRNGWNDLSNSDSVWGNGLFTDEEEDLCHRKIDPLRLQTPSELRFARTQLGQLQKLQHLTLNDSAFASPCVSSPTSSLASSPTYSGNFDIPAAMKHHQQQQRKLSPFGKNMFLHSGSDIDSFSDTSSSSGCSSSGSSSSRAVSQTSTNRYKTELCRPFQENGTCKYGDKCQFAHGFSELRTVARHPKYKTDLCRTYHSSGFCPYGPRCHFIHNLDESANINNSNNGNKARKGGNKEKEASAPGQVPQLPMFSSSQRSSPVSEPSMFPQFNLNEETSPYLARSSTTGIRPAPSAGATGDLSGRSGAPANGGDAAENQTFARLPVFSTLFN